MEERKPNKRSCLTDEEQHLKERLMRRAPVPGEIKHGTGRIPDEFWTMPRPKIRDGSLLEALLKDREEGR